LAIASCMLLFLAFSANAGPRSASPLRKRIDLD
jgi:hypothetical protein